MNATEIAAIYATREEEKTMTITNTAAQPTCIACGFAVVTAEQDEDMAGWCERCQAWGVETPPMDRNVQSAFLADAIMIADAANNLRKAIRDGDLNQIEMLSRMIARKAKLIAEEAASH